MPKWLRALWRLWLAIIVAANTVCGAAMVASAYAHHISPERWGLSTIVTMTFPIWFAAVFIFFILDLVWWRRTAVIPAAAMLACLGTVHSFFPLNLPKLRMSEKERAGSFTLMTYNVFALDEFSGDTTVHRNRQLDYILSRNADIVCLQEAEYLAPTAKNHILESQLDSLHLRYPFVMTFGRNFALLSKFPAQPIELDFPANEFHSGEMTAWRLNIHGQVVNLFSVHLRSLHLTTADKAAYQEVVKLDSVSRSELHDIKADIMPKITSAGLERAQQIRLLQKYLAKYGGVNAIICGDFNDVENSYGLRLLTEGSHMQQVYPQVAFGPDITYHGNYLYFRIDHILYRGNLRPWRLRRGAIGASDHYPLMATFILDAPKKKK